MSWWSDIRQATLVDIDASLPPESKTVHKDMTPWMLGQHDQGKFLANNERTFQCINMTLAVFSLVPNNILGQQRCNVVLSFVLNGSRRECNCPTCELRFMSAEWYVMDMYKRGIASSTASAQGHQWVSKDCQSKFLKITLKWSRLEASGTRGSTTCSLR